MKQIIITLCLLTCLLTALFAKIELDFSDNTVLVVLTPSKSNPNQTLPPSFFKGIEIEQVENISIITNETALETINTRGKPYKAIYKLTLPTNNKNQVQEVIQQLNKLPDIEYAMPNYLFPIDATPNDENYSYLWGLHGTHGIKAPQAWDIATGSHSIRVGVIDTGIANHPDLNANLTTGYDFYNGNTTTTDDINGHGTHVAGIIGAVGNNEIGVVGVNWNVTLVPLQTSFPIPGASSYSPMDRIINAINYATNTWGTDQQISVLNHSISGYGSLPNDPRLVAIGYYPGLFVWSAGNGVYEYDETIGSYVTKPIDVDTYTPYIPDYYLENIIAVGAIQQDGQRVSFSNYSSSGAYVQVFAPGYDILSTVPNDTYANGGGTSMSAPYVSGLAALLLSANPHLTTPLLKQLIIRGADQLTISTPHGLQTVNRLNAHQSVLLASGQTFLSISPTTHNFGLVDVHHTSAPFTFTLSVIGNGSITINDIMEAGPHANEFSLFTDGLPYTLNSGETLNFTVSFTPTSLGAKVAYLYIATNTSESPYIINLSGIISRITTHIPYTEGYNDGFNMLDIGWIRQTNADANGEIFYGTDITRYSGVNQSYAVVMNVYYSNPTEKVYSPTIIGVTSNTILSFAYRIVDYPGTWLYQLTPTPLSANDKIFIEVSTTGGDGVYTGFYTIGNTNHTTSSAFTTIELPLYAYNTKNINIQFRAYRATGDWCFVLDDVHIYNPTSPYPPPQSISAAIDTNNITLNWSPPPNPANLIGYTLSRNITPLITTPTTSLTYTDENIAPGQYTYFVKAVYNQGVSTPQTTTAILPVTIPLSETFDQGTPQLPLSWTGDINQYSGIKPNIGVGNTNALALTAFWNIYTTPNAYTPTIIGTTSQTTLSFAYRLVTSTNGNLGGTLTLKTLSETEKVYIEVSTTGGVGTYSVIHEINSNNHTPTTSFATQVLPLSTYNDQGINIRFRLVSSGYIWHFILDDLIILNSAHPYMPPESLTAIIDANDVILHWTPPQTTDDLLGYTLHRNITPLIEIPTTALTYTDENIRPGVFTYSVRAVYTAGTSEPLSAETIIATPVPFSENFNQTWGLLLDNGWAGSSGLYTSYGGINNSSGLPLLVSSDTPTTFATTPPLTAITTATTLSFAYKITNAHPIALSPGDKIHIEVISYSGVGAYAGLYTIDGTNHFMSADFASIELPLSAYNGQDIAIRFRAVWATNEWFFMLDDLNIYNSTSPFPPPVSIFAQIDQINVTLDWVSPINPAGLIGYTLHRNAAPLITTPTTSQTYTDENVAVGTYIYSVRAVYSEGISIPQTVQVTLPLSDNDNVLVPVVTALHGNYPNPFNPETIIRFSLARECPVVIEVYNLKGQRVRSLAGGVYKAGVHNVVWNGLSDDGRQMGSGVYFYRLVAGEYRAVRKMLLLK